jgi:TetR/AcrR family transcriptional regulator, tetracycline repressor protein
VNGPLAALSVASASVARGTLSRDRVVAAALAIVDRDGLDRLSMRALGRELGVDPMAIYHWIPNKRALLQGVLEAVMRELPVHTDDLASCETWQDVTVATARGLRATLLAHPNAFAVVTSQPVLTAGGLAVLERTASELRRRGLSPAETVTVLNRIAELVVGACLTEVGAGDDGDAEDEAAALEELITPEGFPTLAAALADADPVEDDWDQRFERAVAIWVLGIEAWLRREGG